MIYTRKVISIMAKKQEKTNVMRLLDQKKVTYKEYICEEAEGLTGLEIARLMSQNPAQAFKTLVTIGASKKNYVFVVPVDSELDLKKAAKAVGEKNIEMIKSKELLPLTGYIHGGCSPIGMKKLLTTTIHSSASEFETILFSGGKVGYQVEVKVEDIEKMIPYQMADIVLTKSDDEMEI